MNTTLNIYRKISKRTLALSWTFCLWNDPLVGTIGLNRFSLLSFVGNSFEFYSYSPVTRSRGTTVALLYDVTSRLFSRLSFLCLWFSARLSLGIPRLLLPSGAQVNAVKVCSLAFVMRMWPISLEIAAGKFVRLWC